MFINRQYQKRRYETPKNFPTAKTFRLGDGKSIDIWIADLEAFNAFRRNVGSLDPGKVIIRNEELDKTPFTAKDFEQSLKDGMEFRGELADDGDPRVCGRCLQDFHPKVIPWFNRDTGEKGEGGNFLILKKAQIDDLMGKLKSRPELAEKVKAIAETTTSFIMGGTEVLSRAVALPVCKACRDSRRDEGYVEKSFSLATAREALPLIEQKIEQAFRVGEIQRDAAEISAALGGRRQFHRPVDGGVRSERNDNSGRYNQRDNRGGGRQFERREDTRPRRQWPGSGGAELLVETANALDQHGYTSLEDALVAAKSGKLLEQGIVPSPKALAAVEGFLYHASQNQQTVGGEQPSVIAPGAGRPQTRRTKPTQPRTVTIPDSGSGSDSGKKNRRRNAGGTSPSEALA